MQHLRAHLRCCLTMQTFLHLWGAFLGFAAPLALTSTAPLGSTCLPATGSKVSASPHLAGLYSLCTGQICCKVTNCTDVGTSSGLCHQLSLMACCPWGWLNRSVPDVSSYLSLILTWTLSPTAACACPSHCRGACSHRGCARGRRSGIATCTGPVKGRWMLWHPACLAQRSGSLCC